MKLSDKLIRLGDDHSARLQIITGRLVFPVGPQASDRNDLSVTSREIVRLLSARCVLPLVITGSGNETTPLFERIAKHRLLGDRFSAGIERRHAHLFERLTPPTRDQ